MRKPIKAYGGKGLSVVYAFGDGTGVIRCGGEIGWRSSNPGNINTGNSSKEFGSIGNNGRFVIFPDFDTGRQAIFKLLRKFYLHLTLEKAFYDYAPPIENNTERYIAFVIRRTGYDRKDPMKNLDLGPIVDAIIKWEGYWKGQGKTIEIKKLHPKYTWRTRKDSKVRSKHWEREGDEFDWDNPPEGGHPGEDYGCRCWAEAHEYQCDEKTGLWLEDPASQIQLFTTLVQGLSELAVDREIRLYTAINS